MSTSPTSHARAVYDHDGVVIDVVTTPPAPAPGDRVAIAVTVWSSSGPLARSTVAGQHIPAAGGVAPEVAWAGRLALSAIGEALTDAISAARSANWPATLRDAVTEALHAASKWLKAQFDAHDGPGLFPPQSDDITY